jgi:arylsulfatase A-like enzyme
MTEPQPGRAPRAAGLGIVSIALASGLLEALILVLLRRWHGFAWSGPDAFWMAPLAYLAFYAVAAAPLLLLVWRWPRIARLQHLLAPFLVASCYFLLLVAFTTSLHWSARLLLALGVGLTGSRRLATSLPAPRQWLPVAGSLLVAVGVAALVVVGVPALLERGQAQTPRRGAPSVLLIILDTVRAKSLSLYGYSRRTSPNLERWAARAVVFDSAYAPSSWTLPSHASYFTGRPHRDLRVDWLRPLEDSVPVIAEAFAVAGYRTGGFAANWFYTTRESGLARGFAHYQDFRRSAKQLLLHSAPGQLLVSRHPGHYDRERDVHRKDAAVVRREFLTWAAQDSTQPFFAFLNFFDAHKPYATPPGGHPNFGGMKTAVDGYDVNLWYLDRELGALLEELERRGTLEHTWVVITSDHGELFGEHGLEGHGNSLYGPSVHVPMMVLDPELPEGRRVTRPVTVTDVARTLLEVADVAAPRVMGESLVDCWTQPGCGDTTEPVIGAALTGPEEVPAGDSLSGRPWVAVFSNGWEYLRHANGVEELYLAPGDSTEGQNLAGDPALADTLTRLRGASHQFELPGTTPPRDDP